MEKNMKLETEIATGFMVALIRFRGLGLGAYNSKRTGDICLAGLLTQTWRVLVLVFVGLLQSWSGSFSKRARCNPQGELASFSFNSYVSQAP